MKLRKNYFPGKTNGVNGTSNGSKASEDTIPWNDERDAWWHEEMEDVEPSCYPVWMAAEDPLFILYTRSFFYFSVDLFFK